MKKALKAISVIGALSVILTASAGCGKSENKAPSETTDQTQIVVIEGISEANDSSVSNNKKDDTTKASPDNKATSTTAASSAQSTTVQPGKAAASTASSGEQTTRMKVTPKTTAKAGAVTAPPVTNAPQPKPDVLKGISLLSKSDNVQLGKDATVIFVGRMNAEYTAVFSGPNSQKIQLGKTKANENGIAKFLFNVSPIVGKGECLLEITAPDRSVSQIYITVK